MPSTVATIRPASQGTYNTWTLGAGGSKIIAVSDASDATYNSPSSGTDYDTYVMTAIPTHGGSLASQVKAYFRIDGQTDGSYGLRCRLNGVNLDQGVTGLSAGANTYSWTLTTKPGGGAWTIFDVTAMELGLYVNWSVTQPKLLDVWAEVTYDPIPAKLEQVRLLATHRLLLRRSSRTLVPVKVPIHAADPEIMDLVSMSHTEAPSSSGDGWGEKTWQRRHLRLFQRTIDPNTMTAQLVFEDWRRSLYMLYDECRSRISSSSFANGVGRYYLGTRTYNRNSKAWVVDPSDGTVREVGYDIEQFSGGDFPGQLLEGQVSNLVTRSSFVSGTTGLTLSGTGTNGSTIAVDTGDLLFQSVTTPNSLKFTAGAPHTVEQSVTWAATASQSANSLIVVSIDFKLTSPPAALSWLLRRSSDSKYWRDSDSTWQAAATYNALGDDGAWLTDPTRITRNVSKVIDTGASANTLTLIVAQASGGSDSAIGHVYHVQVEKNEWASSRIVTDATAVTREADTLTFSNAAGAKNWPVTRGVVSFDFAPEWDSDDLALGVQQPTFVTVTYDANNEFGVYYNRADKTFRFYVKVGGVSTTATCVRDLERGESCSVACRWTSSDLEHGLTANTLSVFVDGAKGTDSVSAGGTPTDATSSIVVGPCFGAIRKLFVSQVCYSDAEIARGLPLK